MSDNRAPNVKRPYMISKQASTYLGLSVRTLDGWSSHGDGPPFSRVGKHRLYDPDKIDAWVVSREAKPVTR